MNKLLLFLIYFLIISCNNKIKNKNSEHKNVSSLKEDYEIYELPKDLKEISGITFINDSLIAAVEDEHGKVYFYDLAKRAIKSNFEFAKDGDYEDLVRVGEDLYVVESNGNIYEIKNFISDKRIITKFKTQLKDKNDIEGIAYDKSQNQLLLSIKDKNLNKDKSKEGEEKHIYGFSLTSKTLYLQPVYHINIKNVENHFKGDELVESSKKFLKAVGNKNLSKIISPSAITYYPLNDDLYVLSSVNKIIVVLSKKDSIKNILSFKGDLFRQPEGIAFNSKGEMYISNEGKNKSANIIKFNNLNVK